MSKNVYSSPEAFGLTLVYAVDADLCDLCYGYDITAVWVKDGKVYAARDSGDSAVEPFENYTDITHLTEIRDAEKLRALIGDSSYSPDYDPAEVRDLVNKVHAILQGAK